MNKITLTTAAILTALATSAAANQHSFRDSAKVTQVREVVKSYENRTPRQNCYTEQVAYQEAVPQRKRGFNTGTILGTIIGGALGNELGHSKHNKNAGIAIGAVLGGSIANDIGRKPQQYVTRYRDEQRCNTTTEISYDERVVGYDVTYRYHGQSYTTRMQRNPGNSIKVKVAVTPVN